MDPAATTTQVPPALRTKSKAYQTTIAAEAGSYASSLPPGASSPAFVYGRSYCASYVDDLKYESKYKELRKKVKIVEEVRIQLICPASAYFVLTAVAKCRTMTSYTLGFSKHSTTSSGCDSNERESSSNPSIITPLPDLTRPSSRLALRSRSRWMLRSRAPSRWRAADLVLQPSTPRVPRSEYAPLHAYGISITLKPSFDPLLCLIHIPFCSFSLDNPGRPRVSDLQYDRSDFSPFVPANARIKESKHDIDTIHPPSIIYERVAQLGPPPAPQAAAPPSQEPPAGHQGGQGGHPPRGPPANSGPQPHPLSQSFRAPQEQPTPAPPQTHQHPHRPHPEDASHPYQQARRHPEPPIDEPQYNRSRSPSVGHRRLYEGTPNQKGWDAKQPPPGPNYHPSPRQPADYHPRSHSRDTHGPRYPHDNQQGPPSQDRLPPIRVQERQMSIEQPIHGHPPPPSHGQHPVTTHPSFSQANGHSQHIPQSTPRSSIHQGGPQPLTNPYPERTGSHSSSSASRHESRERHQKLRWEEPRRPPADSPQVEMSPVRFAGDKMRMRAGAGEDGAYGSSTGGSMPLAPGMPRMEREAFDGPPEGSPTGSPAVYRRDSMMEVSPIASPDGDMSRGQRMR